MVALVTEESRGVDKEAMAGALVAAVGVTEWAHRWGAYTAEEVEMTRRSPIVSRYLNTL